MHTGNLFQCQEQPLWQQGFVVTFCIYDYIYMVFLPLKKITKNNQGNNGT